MKAIHPLLLSLFLSLAASVATVAQPFSFDFSTEDQWLDNFRVRSPDPNHFFWSPDGYVQGWQKPGEEEGEPSALWWGVAIYDTATEEPGYANGTYLDETIVARFSTNTLTADPSFSVFARLRSDWQIGVLGTVHIPSEDRIRLILFYDVDVASLLGAAKLVDVEFAIQAGGMFHRDGSGGNGTTGKTIGVDEILTVVVEQTAEAQPQFRLTVYKEDMSFLATTDWQTHPFFADYAEPGSVGFRTVAGGSGAQYVRVHGFETIADVPDAGYAVWRSQHFADPEGADAADDADPDGDGVANLLEYAFGGDPNESSGGLLPAADSIDGQLAIHFRRIAPALFFQPDVGYSVESSDDLIDWAPVVSLPAGESEWAGSWTVSESLEDGWVNVTVREPLPFQPGDFDFSDASQFVDYFRITTSGTHLSWQSPGVVQGRQGSNFLGTAIYDSDPESPEWNDTGFLTEELRADVAWNTINNQPSFQLFTRVQEATGRGVLARVLFVSGTNIRFQLRYDASAAVHPADGNQGSIRFFDWEYNVFAGGGGFYHLEGGSGASGGTGHTLEAGVFYQFVLEQTDDPDPEFRLSAYTPEGDLLATTGFQTLTATDAYDGPGAVGFGTLAGGSGAQIMQVDRFTIEGLADGEAEGPNRRFLRVRVDAPEAIP